MSTVTEIEAALPALSAEELRRVGATVHRLQNEQRNEPADAGASAAHFGGLDSLIGSWREDAEFDAAIRAFEQVDEAMRK